MCAHMHILLQRRVYLCCLFSIAKNTTTLSHLCIWVIAISIIYNDVQWWGPRTILTNRLTEINAAAQGSLSTASSMYPFLQTSTNEAALASHVILTTPTCSVIVPFSSCRAQLFCTLKFVRLTFRS